jgi:6-phosphogluconolactonase
MSMKASTEASRARKTAVSGPWPLRLGLTAVLTAALSFSSACGSSPFSSSESTHLAYVAAGQNVYAYRIKDSSGSATSVIGSPFVAGISPSSIVIDPSSHFAYVANQSENTISLFKIDSKTGALSEVLPRIQTGFAPTAMTMDAGAQFLFVANQGSNSLSVFSIGSSGGLSEAVGSPYLLAGGPSGITFAANSSGEFLFAPVPAFSAIYAFSVSSGSLTPVTALPFVVSGGVGSLAVDPAGKFLFVPNPSANTLTVLDIGQGGVLSPGPGAFATGSIPRAATTDTTGAYLYVANFGGSNVSQFTVDSATGDLTAFSTATIGAGTQPSFTGVGPDGKFLFVGNQGSNSVNEFTIKSDGTLSSTGNSIQTGAAPHAIAFAK